MQPYNPAEETACTGPKAIDETAALISHVRGILGRSDPEAAMRVLLIGSGGREHALAWALSASPLLTQLYRRAGKRRHLRHRRMRGPRSVGSFRHRHLSAAAGISIWWSSGRRRRLSPGWWTISSAPASAPSARRRRRRSLKARRASPRISAARPAFRPPPIDRFTDRAAAREYVDAPCLADRGEGRRPRRRQGRDDRRGQGDGARRHRRDTRRPRRGARDRGIPAKARRRVSSRWRTGATSSLSARRRTTSAPSMATRARIPAAWAPIPRRRS